MREMDRKDFDLPPVPKLMLAFSAFGPAGFAVCIVVAATSGRQENDALTLRLSFYVAALFMFVLAARNLRRLLTDSAPITFTKVFVEERYFGLGQISWVHMVAVEPSIEDRRGIQVKTLFIEVTKPWTYLNAMTFYQRMFLPLRTWRTQLLPLYFGSFNHQFEEAIDWIESYKPGILIRWKNNPGSGEEATH